MITGKDLIIYILENNLLDEPICQNGKLLGFYTESEAAIAFGVGRATIRIWIERGMLNTIKIGDLLFIPKTETNPLERNQNEKNNPNVGSVSTHGVNESNKSANYESFTPGANSPERFGRTVH